MRVVYVRACVQESRVDMDVCVTIVASRHKRELYTRQRALHTRKRALYTQKSPAYAKKPCILAKEYVTIVASRRATATLLCVGESVQVRECAREKKADIKICVPIVSSRRATASPFWCNNDYDLLRTEHNQFTKDHSYFTW